MRGNFRTRIYLNAVGLGSDGETVTRVCCVGVIDRETKKLYFTELQPSLCRLLSQTAPTLVYQWASLASLEESDRYHLLRQSFEALDRMSSGDQGGYRCESEYGYRFTLATCLAMFDC